MQINEITENGGVGYDGGVVITVFEEGVDVGVVVSLVIFRLAIVEDDIFGKVGQSTGFD